MLEFGQRFDVLLSPVSADPAPVHGALSGAQGIDPTSFTTAHNLTGWPAATVRCGTSAAGLPIGLQLVANPWRDDLALAAAAALEAALGGWRPSAILPGP
jgi:amidase